MQEINQTIHRWIMTEVREIIRIRPRATTHVSWTSQLYPRP